MKKKLIWLIVVALSACIPHTSCAEEKEGFFKDTLYARSAVLMDADSGRVLYGKDPEIPLPMASTTKIMTCIIALENMEDNEKAVVSAAAAGQPKVRLGVNQGEEYYIEDLLYSLMLESHNDSAVIIAEKLGGSVGEFARMMNRKARDIGCKDTYFITPNGLDDDDEKGVHHTTARDLSLIMRYCLCTSPMKDRFLEITATREYSFSEIKGKRQFSCRNRNAFLSMMEGALSGKTGFTCDAGYCYVGAMRRDRKTLIVALLGCGWPNNREYKWKDTRKLMEYGLSEFHFQSLPVPGKKIVCTVTNAGNDSDVCERNIKTFFDLDPPERKQYLVGTHEKITLEIDLPSHIRAPVSKGEVIGSAAYMIGEDELCKVDLVMENHVEKRDFRWCLNVILKLFYFIDDTFVNMIN